MTREQLKRMTDRELVTHARAHMAEFPNDENLLVHDFADELANRLDDRYPFTTTETEEPET